MESWKKYRLGVQILSIAILIIGTLVVVLPHHVALSVWVFVLTFFSAHILTAAVGDVVYRTRPSRWFKKLSETHWVQGSIPSAVLILISCIVFAQYQVVSIPPEWVLPFGIASGIPYCWRRSKDVGTG